MNNNQPKNNELQNSQFKLNRQTALAAAVVGGIGLVPFVLATSHHVSSDLVNQVDVEEAGIVAEKTVENSFLIAGPKRPIHV